MSAAMYTFLVVRADRLAAGAADAVAALDRLLAAVEALTAQRDAACAWGSAQQDAWRQEAKARREAQAAGALSGLENFDLRDRIGRATAELDAAPDTADPERPTKREAKAMAEANLRAWHVLTEGRDPLSVRRAEHMPRDAGGAA